MKNFEHAAEVLTVLMEERDLTGGGAFTSDGGERGYESGI